MTTVLVPPLPGALSAVGILLAEGVRDLSRTVMLPGESLDAEETLETHFLEMERALVAADTPELHTLERSVDLRYQGQGYELNVPHGPSSAEHFHALHEQRFGFADKTRALDVVTLRVRLRTPGPAYAPMPEAELPCDGSQAQTGKRDVWFHGGLLPTNLYTRDLLKPGDQITGPALIVEYSSTTVLPPNWYLRVDGYGMLVLERTNH